MVVVRQMLKQIGYSGCAPNVLGLEYAQTLPLKGIVSEGHRWRKSTNAGSVNENIVRFIFVARAW